MAIKNIIFDFGGVLVDWNPRYLYKNHFKDEAEMEHFLENVTTEAWNLEQDRGRSLADGTQILQNQYPEHRDLIQLFYDNWEVMLNGEISGTVELLHRLKKKYKIYGLTNWSAETIPVAFERHSFFKEFDGIVVSGHEKMIKPDKNFYQILFDRYQIKPEESVFIDDNIKNIHSAREIGLYAIHFKNPTELEKELLSIGVI